MICPNCCGAGCRASGFGRFPQQEKMHAVYGNCAACSGTGVVEFEDIVEVFLSDWRATQARIQEQNRIDQAKMEQKWAREEEEDKKKREEMAQRWRDQQELFRSESRRIQHEKNCEMAKLKREQAEAEWKERWRLTFELYGIPKEKMDSLTFPPTNRQ